MTKSYLLTAWKLFLVCVLVAAWIGLNGCESTEKVLSGVDYACIDIQADGPWTDSGAQGRGIKIPEGETLSSETIGLLCN